MNYFKKLFLSATTILITAGAVDPAHAFFLLKSRKEVNNTEQQKPQSNNKLKLIPAPQAQKKDAFLVFKQILDSGNEAEIQKTRTELIDFLINFNAMAPTIQGVNQRKDELQVLRQEIIALKKEITHLRALTLSQQQESQDFNEIHGVFNIHSISQPDPLSIDALPPLDFSTRSNSSVLEENSLTPKKEDISQQTILSGVMTALPTDEQASSLTSNPSLSQETWEIENFEQAVLRIKPSNLETMPESEIELWRTFTMLTFTNQDENKPWSSWGGAYSTEELEEKFKDNTFIKTAFKDIAQYHLSANPLIFFPDYVEYFVVPSPEREFDAKKDADLTKAYYFRGLYKSLTGNNWSGRNMDSSAVEFKIDLTAGIKGSRFTYGSSRLESPQYETSIYEAEEYFKNTPWHALFINKVIQATLKSLPNPTKRTQEIMEKYNPEILRITTLITANDDMEYTQKLPITNQEEQESFPTEQLQAELFKLMGQKSQEIEAVNSQTPRLLRATSLRDIDDALSII